MAIRQRTWRITAAVAIGLAAFMAWLGSEWTALRESWMLLMAYWSVFFALFVLAMLIVWLDLRYIRLLYVLEERKILRDTLDETAFRKDLQRSHRAQVTEQGGEDSDADQTP